MADERDKLYSLIHALGTEPRRAVRRYLEQQGDSKTYLKIWITLERQERYDREALRAELAGMAVLNNLSKAKNALYKIALRVLGGHFEIPDDKVLLYMRYAQILVDHGQYEEALGYLREGKAIANQEERFPYLTMLLDLEAKIISLHLETEREAKLEAIDVETVRVDSLIRELRELERIQRAIDRLLRARFQARGEMDKGIAGDLKHSLSLFKEGLGSNRARLLYFNCAAQVSKYLMDFPSALEEGLMLIDLYEQQEFLLAENRFDYLRNYRSCCRIALAIQRHVLFETLMKKVEKITSSTEKEAAEIWEWRTEMTLSYALQLKDIASGERTVREMEEGLKRFQEQIGISSLIWLQYLIAYYKILIGEYGKAMPHLLAIIETHNSDSKLDLQAMARILYLLVRIETDDLVYIDSRTRQILRYLKDRKQLFKFESLFLKLVNKLQQSVDRAERNSLFDQFNAEAAKLFESAEERAVLDYFPFNIWIRSRTEHTTLASLFWGKEPMLSRREEPR